jgi:predicted SprT family Zn-dependent metalloprotease
MACWCRFAPERWKDAGNKTTHEISLNPAYLTRETQKDSASTLVHEMAHLWRHEQGNPPRGGYHDRQWADKMVELGLMPSSTAAPGGARTGYKMSHYIYVRRSVTCSCAGGRLRCRRELDLL